VAAAALAADTKADSAATVAAARAGTDRLSSALARCGVLLATLHAVASPPAHVPPGGAGGGDGGQLPLPCAVLSGLLEPVWAALAALGRALEDVAAVATEGDGGAAAGVGASLAACAPAATFGGEPLPSPPPPPPLASDTAAAADTDAALAAHVYAAEVLLAGADGVLAAGLAGAASAGAFTAGLAPASSASSRWATPLARLQTQRLGIERAAAARAAATAALVGAVCCPGTRGAPCFPDALAHLALGRHAPAAWPGVLLRLEGLRQRLLRAAAGAKGAAAV
jgi:hypothetical protein